MIIKPIKFPTIKLDPNMAKNIPVKDPISDVENSEM